MTTLAPASRKLTDNVWCMCGTRAATCRRASDGAHVTLAVRGVDLLADQIGRMKGLFRGGPT